MNMNKRGKLFSAFFFTAAIASLVLFQNCSQVNYTITGDHGSKVPKLATSEGGEVYDGKPRILHHYVPGFQCEGRPQPESILLSQDDTNWRLIQNSPEKCAVQDKVPVTGVVYNSATNQAVYLGKTYVPPIPFYVDASEDPNLPDKKLEDGVCENVNNKCSLLAAVQQAGVVSYTADSVVEIPPATYSLTRNLDLHLSIHDNTVHLRGASGGNKPVLDGQGTTSHLYVDGFSGSVIVENLRFVNGFPSYIGWVAGLWRSTVINLRSSEVALDILDSEFSNNVGSSVIHGTLAGPISIFRSRFTNNSNPAARSGIIEYVGNNGLLIEDTLISGNNGNGVYVRGPTRGLIVDRSAIIGTSIYNTFGLFVEDCFSCVVRNSTVYGHGFSGLVIKADREAGADAGLQIVNSTVLANGTSGSPNIQISLEEANQKVDVINTVIATNGIGNSNCDFGADDPRNFHTLIAINSLFDDTSCAPTGSDNIIGLSPQLGSFGDHGGLTPTLLPLPGSPLIDAGDNNFCPILDQRGQSRPVDKLGAGPRCDIGAVEVDK